MYIEKRKAKSGIKYYLVYSYREQGEVRKLRKYLGKNLSKEQLLKAKKRAKEELMPVLEELKTEIFNFSLTKNQIKRLNLYENKIKISHLENINWERFTREFVYNTNAIEGSTVRLNEVKRLLKKERKPEDNEEIETNNVAKAVEFIRKTKEDLSLNFIKKIHKVCFENTKDFAGQFRNVNVVIRNSKEDIVHTGVPFEEVEDYLKDMIMWYKKNKEKFKPIVLAAIIHNQFEHIHPFQDGNGRVGRLLLNFILLKNKYPPININLNDRSKYYNVLQQYSKKQNIKLTIEFLTKQYRKTLKRVSTKRNKSR